MSFPPPDSKEELMENIAKISSFIYSSQKLLKVIFALDLGFSIVSHAGVFLGSLSFDSEIEALGNKMFDEPCSVSEEMLRLKKDR